MLYRRIVSLSAPRVTCRTCGTASRLISSPLELCASCLKHPTPETKERIETLRRRGRRRFDLPEEIPRDPQGVLCTYCANQCRIPAGGYGFCGLRENREGKLYHLGGTAEKGLVEWYFDPLPTNCVADWVCPGGTGAGYQKYAYRAGPEHGYRNVAVFYEACSFDCLFCQNWHFRQINPRRHPHHLAPADDLAETVEDPSIACICYFGGDPSVQMPHALAASRQALKLRQGKILRICWESNGRINPKFLGPMAELSLESGGCIKFDLKAWDENLHLALCGVSPQVTRENFKTLAKMIPQRPEPPFLIASTLLVPGYIDAEEVGNIARFLADLHADIPYSLLGFYPHFFMSDLPTTSRSLAEECLAAAQKAGLTRVRLGNPHLLAE